MTYERLSQKFRCGKCHADLSPPAQPVELKKAGAWTAFAGFPVVLERRAGALHRARCSRAVFMTRTTAAALQFNA